MRYLFLIGLLALVSRPVARQTRPSVAPENGAWEPPFQHDTTGFALPPARFEAVHMALIPRGPHRGHVLVWDVQGPQASAAWHQRWAIVDADGADAPRFWNEELVLPAERGDLFCSGHAWTASGELLVAGGTSRYPSFGHHGQGILGGKLVYLWDPTSGANGTWRRQPDLAVDRWYPTVALLDTQELLIAGGIPGERPALDDYEVFDLRPGAPGHTRLAAAGRFPGPALPASPFDLYPRLHQLENGEQFLAGPGGGAAKMDHALAPGSWSPTGSLPWFQREHVNSVLAPRRPGASESVWTIGGEAFDAFDVSQGVLADVEACVPGAAGAPGWDWTPLSPMHEARACANAVLLPDGQVLVIGGRTSAQPVSPERATTVPELFDGRRWRQMSPAASPRTYHSTAVLLPSGKVLSGGGDSSIYDYQVFAPPYVHSPARPRILAAPDTLPYSTLDASLRTIAFAPLPSHEVVARVVLIAPGSVTHHFDASQRYVELAIVGVTASSVSFRGPSHAALAPAGDYMLFLVTASGIPGVAHWVYVG